MARAADKTTMASKEGEAEPRAGQVGCSMSSVLLRHVETVCGEDAVGDLLRRAGSPRSAAFLEDTGNWITYQEAIGLFEVAADLTGDPQVGLRVGEQTVRQHSG